uniref:Uncharacterized protein n=1 Tax=Octopus bimaculoides TaxID=37653 RepID=A0A0L8FW79_OCTBM
MSYRSCSQWKQIKLNILILTLYYKCKFGFKMETNVFAWFLLVVCKNVILQLHIFYMKENINLRRENILKYS